jgi:hypothetical protein
VIHNDKRIGFFATELQNSKIHSIQKFAQKHSHSLNAHEHGAIKLNIVIDGKDIEFEIDGPSESFLGFEHSPA